MDPSVGLVIRQDMPHCGTTAPDGLLVLLLSVVLVVTRLLLKENENVQLSTAVKYGFIMYGQVPRNAHADNSAS